MKTAITVTTTIQTGMDEWKDVNQTKIFDDTATIREMNEWVNSIYKGGTFHTCQISKVVE